MKLSDPSFLRASPFFAPGPARKPPAPGSLGALSRAVGAGSRRPDLGLPGVPRMGDVMSGWAGVSRQVRATGTSTF